MAAASDLKMQNVTYVVHVSNSHLSAQVFNPLGFQVLIKQGQLTR